jgi:hypothetical protein
MVTMINFSKEIKVFYDIPRDFSEIYDAVRRVIVPLNPSQDNKRLRVRYQHSGRLSLAAAQTHCVI